MNCLKEYRGYEGSIEFCEESKVFHGELLGINDMVTFEADQLEDLERAFHEMVDDYLDWCKADGHEPKKPTQKFASPSRVTNNTALIRNSRA